MIFLVSSGKMIFLFSENIILFFRRKMKDDLSQKNTWNYDIFFKCSEKMVFPKKLDWNMIFLIWRVISFSRKYDIFFTDGKWKMIFLKKYMETWCFLYVGKVHISFSYKYEITLLSKKPRWSFPEKIHIKMTFPALLKKMIFTLEKMILAFSVLLWRLFKCFHILLSNKENPGNLIYRIEIWLYL